VRVVDATTSPTTTGHGASRPTYSAARATADWRDDPAQVETEVCYLLR
jgi:hypothetical protein